MHTTLITIAIANTDWSIVDIAKQLNLLLALITRLLTIIIYIEVYIKRKMPIEILEKLQKIDEIFAKHLQVQQNYNTFQQQLIFDGSLWIVESIFLTIFTIGHALSASDRKSNVPICLFMISFVINSLRYMQFCIFTRLVKIRFEVIQQSLRRINRLEVVELDKIIKVKDTSNPFLMKLNTIDANLGKTLVYQEIVYLRQCYHFLWETSLLINKCFRWTLPIAIGNDFCFLVTNFYWLFLLAINAEPDTIGLIMFPIVWAAANMRRIITVSYICHSAIEKV